MYEKRLTRCLPLLLGSFTTAIAIVLVAVSDQRDIGSFNAFVSSHRDTLALIIQVVSSGLGACQVYTVASLLNYWRRIYIQRHAVTLQSLKFWSAISGLQVRTSVPLRYGLIIAAFVIAMKIPEAFWAGALTPIFVDHVLSEGSIALPRYDSDSASYWQGGFAKYDNGTFVPWTRASSTKDYGGAYISTVPAIDFIGGLINTAISASTAPGAEARTHSRLDGSGWSFAGRSFGVGSSPGLITLTSLPSHEIQPRNLTFHESGYDAQVVCAYNESSEYFIVGIGTINSTSEAVSGTQIWLANGTAPNSKAGVIESYTLTTTVPNLLAWTTVLNENRYMLVSAAYGVNYAAFDKVQCEVTFRPTRYRVSVSLADKIITVSKAPVSEQIVADFEPTHLLVNNVFLGLEVISRTAGQYLESILGHALRQNSIVLYDGQESLANISLRGMEESVTALLDDLLVSYAQAQTALIKEYTTTPLEATYSAVRIGSDKYIYLTLGSCCLVLLLAVIEALRTRLWRDLARFDFTDVQGMTIATSLGGRSIGTRATALHAKYGSKWQGDPGDRLAGLISVKLVLSPHNGFALLNKDDEFDAEQEMMTVNEEHATPKR
jgi:hypothetical protein